MTRTYLSLPKAILDARGIFELGKIFIQDDPQPLHALWESAVPAFSMDASNVGQMTETGAIDALLDLLRSHQCEEPAGRLLEAVFNNVRVREVKVPK